MRTQPLPAMAAAGGGLPAALPLPALHSPPEEQLQARALVARLRDHVARIEQNQNRLEPRRGWQDRSPQPAKAWTLGVPVLDAHLPAQGLARHGLHDVSPVRYGDNAAAMGFALGLAILRLNTDRKQRPMLWCRSAIECREHGKLYGHGAEQLGLSRQKLLTVSLKKAIPLFWTMEEALKSGCFACVLSDAAVQQTDLTVTRRLNLASGDGQSAGLIVFNRNYPEATASYSRWQVAAQRSLPPPLEPGAPGPPAWAVTLSRIRGGRPGHWTLTWNNSTSPQNHHAPHHFSLVPGISGGALPQGAPQAPGTFAAERPALRAG